MSSYGAEGIVLRRRDLGESDRVAALLTRGLGKFDVVAKGARKPGAKSAGPSEPFTAVRVLIAQGRSLDIVTQWQVTCAHAPLRADLGALARAAYVCELADALTVDHEPCEAVHDLVGGALDALELACGGELTICADAVLHSYVIRLLAERGYAISLARCAHCGVPIKSEAALGFSAALGGALCGRCRYASPDSFGLRPPTLRALRTLAEADSASVFALRPDPPVERQIRDCLRWSVRFRCERELRSASFLELTRGDAATPGAA